MEYGCLILSRDGPTLCKRGAIAPCPIKKKKIGIKKLNFALIYIYVSPPLKYLDIDLQKNK